MNEVNRCTQISNITSMSTTCFNLHQATMDMRSSCLGQQGNGKRNLYTHTHHALQLQNVAYNTGNKLKHLQIYQPSHN